MEVIDGEFRNFCKTHQQINIIVLIAVYICKLFTNNT